jgi:hypothetical protein
MITNIIETASNDRECLQTEEGECETGKAKRRITWVSLKISVKYLLILISSSIRTRRGFVSACEEKITMGENVRLFTTLFERNASTEIEALSSELDSSSSELDST